MIVTECDNDSDIDVSTEEIVISDEDAQTNGKIDILVVLDATYVAFLWWVCISELSAFLYCRSLFACVEKDSDKKLVRRDLW